MGAPPILFENVRIFDGRRVLSGRSVLALDGRIAAVGRAVPRPRRAAVIPGGGLTLLPGLIDAHTHTWRREWLRVALIFGVTTQIDMLTPPRLAARMRREQAGGAASGRADLVSAGAAATAPGGHGTGILDLPAISAPHQAAAFVQARIAEGSDFIKIILEDGGRGTARLPALGPATLEALVREAHSGGKRAVVHVTSRRRARQAVAAGADGLAHVYRRGRPDAALAAEMRRRRTFVIPTLVALEAALGIPGAAAAARDPRLFPFVPSFWRGYLARPAAMRPGARAKMARARRTVGALYHAGVTLLAGADSPNAGTAPGVSLHRELELLVLAGLSPPDALRAATSAPAAAFGLEGKGRIAPGCLADLLLVRGNPARDIACTRDIVGVWKRGVPVERTGRLTSPGISPG